MTNSKLILTASAAALLLSAATSAAMAAERGALAQNDIVIAADDSDKGSAKMGEGAGTQAGDEGATQENDTQKIDQPARHNPTPGADSGDDGQDDVMPPAEDEDEGPPSEGNQE